ncbi:DUF4304 domain-containing protein [Flavobacterium sp. KACC 22763]|uniref:DUF4304 domain-containing protein n=1 Tax=Flavobacterium sp. KACC 22763 TaxID=3025668 RepID=UPI0023651DE4|nr:DUF4304 domain-containing protein [Flavobacterium sp. KACC 22763]WDF63358.1 DUF4304 domain-containing protein [Flavobacterium sp. KACC 22763]
MNPKDLITTSIEKTLLKPLTQIGFTFSKSTLTFKRKVDEFVQTIHFQLNRHNQENVSAEFWTSFGISSNLYSKWHKTNFNENPINSILSSSMDWNIKNWEFPVINDKKESHFQIISEKERENVLQTLKNNVLNIGVPFLDNLSNWENAANKLVEEKWFHYKACDFFLIAGNNEKAFWALQQGIDYWSKNPKASFPEDKEKIQIRLSKYFGR